MPAPQAHRYAHARRAAAVDAQQHARALDREAPHARALRDLAYRLPVDDAAARGVGHAGAPVGGEGRGAQDERGQGSGSGNAHTLMVGPSPDASQRFRPPCTGLGTRTRTWGQPHPRFGSLPGTREGPAKAQLMP